MTHLVLLGGTEYFKSFLRPHSAFSHLNSRYCEVRAGSPAARPRPDGDAWFVSSIFHIISNHFCYLMVVFFCSGSIIGVSTLRHWLHAGQI